ncbi:hypothetical protein CANTEDRAFT_100500 [Yamadazyma tenuis ATCC 10573]|uniref:SH3 domain-containing protein n=1 Tax=Candida tenuis (strain ATCC 10573 / BCRC 21748 / CBS 615 / JCM 9827 / NBRC 10315 / NRRL Y-1498 / VKM Y-70) TaxID=590646 RepID=G3AW24_CANTC|nr:uncharacterized protein CANTEDRAFT_100500 [Yamadazyma tenuis ATCC 10573]EGV66432.1 hypothetical protein CANTEDRAFT_100500 [Yamadazyma tenuis ATCC 10573]
MSVERIKNTVAPDKIKNNLTHFGNSISTSIGSNVSNVKNTFKKKTYDSDDELISQYQHDIKRSIKAMKYILSQIHRMANAGIPKLFKSHMKGVELFSKLIGAGSLHFEGIQEFYHEFDKLQAESETPMVHPKEMDFEVPAINEQIYNYMVSVDRLTSKTLDDWDLFYQENKLRVIEMNDYLKGTLKLISKRNKKQYEYENTHKKLEKLMKKTSQLDDKEQKQMVTLEKKLNQVKYTFEKLDDKTKTILPHVLLLLEEFIDSISKIIFFKQYDTLKSIYDTIKYFTTYYGYFDGKDDNDYNTITDAWENAMTPVRLQLETFITIIQEKNPELINQEIDDEDKTSKATKMWNKVTNKMTEKTFNLKVDKGNGIFNGHLIADQLNAFLEYHNPNSFRSETYFPSKIPKIPDLPIIVEENNPLPPPLPPRQNTARQQIFSATPRLGVLTSLPSTPSIASPKSPLSVAGGFEAKSSMQSISTSQLVEDTKKGNPKLVKVYNASKNSIGIAPITAPLNANIIPPGDNFKTSSITHKLDEFTEFFDKVLVLEPSSERRKFEAKHDFEGVEPGDMSFRKGDHIEIIFEFHDFMEGDNQGIWLVGMNEQEHRVGLVPSNYF